MTGLDDEYAQVLAELEASRELALRDPLTLALDLTDNAADRPHIRAISDAVQDLYEADDYDKLMVLMPPQSGKSWMVGVWSVFWWLCRNPRTNVILASYGASLAAKRGKAVRRLVEEHGAEFGLHMASGSSAADDWELTSGGSMRCAGISGGITGRSGDLIVCDDLFADLAEANSKTIRENVANAWSGTLLTRLQPNGKIIYIQTPWHPEDLSQTLPRNEPDAWRVLKLPAFANSGDDPIGRLIGEPLPHPKLPDDEERLAQHWNGFRSGGVRVFNAMYQLDPQPAEGSLVSWEVMENARAYDHTAEPVRSAVSVDPSGGGRDTCGIIAGFRGDDGIGYLTHDWTDVLPVAKWPRKVCRLAWETKADAIVWESNFGADMVKRLIRLAWRALQADDNEDQIPPDVPCPRLIKVTAKKGKYLRAEPVAQMWEESKLKLAVPMPDLVREWCTWQPDSKDSPGRIDASTYLALHLVTRTPSTQRHGMSGVSHLSKQAFGQQLPQGFGPSPA